jgi:hypothetical protein
MKSTEIGKKFTGMTNREYKRTKGTKTDYGGHKI